MQHSWISHTLGVFLGMHREKINQTPGFKWISNFAHYKYLNFGARVQFIK